MPVRIVQSKQNARLKELRRALRAPGREPGSLIGIEGPNLLEEALRAGLHIRCVFATEESFSRQQRFRAPSSRLFPAARAGDPDALRVSLSANPFEGEPSSPWDLIVLPPAILSSALETETPQPVAALVEPPEWSWTDLLGRNDSAALIVILAGLQDPGNLGTILRSAEAFGANGIVALPGTVSPWNQKAMRASAGSVFRLPVIQAGVDECFTHLREARVKVLTTAAHGAAPADAVNLAPPVAILIGNEGNGVPDEIAEQAGVAVTIPCPGLVESLNASVAASVLLYEAARQRRAASGDTRSGS